MGFLQIPRPEATSALAEAVSAMSPDQFDTLELTFLSYAQHQVHPLLKIRAMELYAFMKLLEVQRFGWRDFCGSTEAGRLE